MTYAYRPAEVLADEVALRLPDSFAFSQDELTAVVLPVAVRLVLAEGSRSQQRTTHRLGSSLVVGSG